MLRTVGMLIVAAFTLFVAGCNFDSDDFDSQPSTCHCKCRKTVEIVTTTQTAKPTTTPACAAPATPLKAEPKYRVVRKNGEVYMVCPAGVDPNNDPSCWMLGDKPFCTSCWRVVK